MPPHNPGKKQPHSKKESGPSPDQKGYSTSEAIIALKDELVEEAKANREQENRPDTTHKRLEIATLVFVIFTTIGVFIQACVLHNSDKAFQISAVAAKDAADAAKAAVELSSKTAERQLRAYVYVDEGRITIDEKRRLKAVLKLKNYGQTPAYELTAVTNLSNGSPGKKAPNLPPDRIQKVEKSKSTLGPSGIDRPISFQGDGVQPIDQATFEGLNNGDRVPYLTLQVRYRDAFNRKWVLDMKFVGMRTSGEGWELSPQPEGNQETEEK